MLPEFPEIAMRGRVGGTENSFRIRHPKTGIVMLVIATNGTWDGCQGWDHVSVSTRNRPPNWDEMSFIKDLFWRADETVVQFHPKRSEYVNNHPHCLHMWKKVSVDHELPPAILTGLLEKESA